MVTTETKINQSSKGSRLNSYPSSTIKEIKTMKNTYFNIKQVYTTGRPKNKLGIFHSTVQQVQDNPDRLNSLPKVVQDIVKKESN